MGELRITIPDDIAKFVEAENCDNFNVDRYFITQTQIDIINDIEKNGQLAEKLHEYNVDYVNTTLLYGPTGTGKAQPLYSKVLTPTGFVLMGDLSVGDTVISGTGHKSKILGIYPQGKKPIYELTFRDGGKCRCSDEHIWHVQTSSDREIGYNSRYRDIELKDMIDKISVRKDGRKNYSIDYINPLDFDKKEYVIHPYVMGALLGDGSFREKESIRITTGDQEILDNLIRFLPARYSITHCGNYDYRITGDGKQEGPGGYIDGVLRRELKNYGLSGLGSNDKFIPSDYLLGSYEQRMWLLKGLLDTDGYAWKRGIEYCTTSLKLAEDVVSLVRSLGGYSTMTSRMGSYKKNNKLVETQINYRITIQFTSKHEKVFSLKRKNDAYEFKRETQKRYLDKIEYVGEEECQCIYIDDPSHLYITDDYIITHNTTFARFVANRLDKDFVYLNFSSLMDGGFGNTERNLSKVFRYMTAQDCIFMVDEIDCIATSRTASTNDTLKSITIALMQELDHCKSHNPKAIILAATNVVDNLDPALLSRFSIKKEIPLLNNEEKLGFVLKYLNDLDVPYDVDQLREYIARNSRVTQRVMEQDIIRALIAWIDSEKQGFINVQAYYNY